jgi:hypothetical protein
VVVRRAAQGMPNAAALLNAGLQYSFGSEDFDRDHSIRIMARCSDGHSDQPAVTERSSCSDSSMNRFKAIGSFC